jgi:hypothetical protein
MNRAQVMTIVHERFAMANPELEHGFAEHVTMGADAMLSLGIAPGSVQAWAMRHQPALLPAGSEIGAAHAVILAELAAGEWRDVARSLVIRLAGDLDAHLFHGLIRAAHAVRTLERHDDQAGRRELVLGLDAWAIWAGSSVPRGFEPPAQTGDLLAAITDAARRGAGAFVAKLSIVTLHAVTAPLAFLLVADLLDRPTFDLAARVLARTHARYPEFPDGLSDPAPKPSPASLESLVSEWDAHPAKLAEAALRGHSLSGETVFLDAAIGVLR